jgi:type II pantothenate kinase|tara:strand:- start:2300 stop:3115 length:816 start_codon:yes stop_codon:yes gene_type:complete
MFVGIDFGVTNTDIAVWSNDKYTFFSLPSEKIDNHFLSKIFEFIKININDINKIAVTGGKSSDLNNNFKNISILKVNEVSAIGYGAMELYKIKEDNFVAVSAGTGTACISYSNREFNHLGGISVGGGTLQGLSNLIIKNNNADNINQIALSGNKNQLDFLIGDVVNEIGSLYPEITASNFAKARSNNNQKDEDIASSLSNMIGEVIGTVTYLNALLMGVDKVYFLGRTSLLDSVKKGIDQRLALAGIVGEYNSDREFGNAIGAIAYLRTKI